MVESKVKVKTSGLVSCFLLSVLFVNIAIIPVDIETQPVFCVLFSLVFMVVRLKQRGLLFDQNELVVLGLLLLIIFYFAVSLAGPYPVSYDAFVKYIIGPFVFLSFYPFARYVTPLPVIFFVCACFLVMVGLYLNFSPISYLYVNFADYFLVRTYFDVSGDSVRGMSYFSAEPSYAAINFAFCLAVVELSSLSGRKKNLLVVLCIILMLSTKSMMAVLVIVLYLASKYLRRISLFRGGVGGLAVTSLLYLLWVAEVPRFVQIISAFDAISESRMSLSEYFVAYSLLEPSGSTRIIANAIGFLGMIEEPLGRGLGAFSYQWVDTVSNFKLYFVADHEALGQHYVERDKISAQTYFFNIIYDCGLLAFVLFGLFFYRNILACVDFYSLGMTFSLSIVLLGFLFQGQISNPLFWVLSALVFGNSNEKKLLDVNR